MEIRFEEYVRNVRSNAQTAPVLAAWLEQAAPEDLSPAGRKALRQVMAASLEVKAVNSERERLAPAKLRPVLDAFVNYWSAFYEALLALSRLPPTTSRNGPVAAEIVASLFPDAVGFTKLPSYRAWSEADRLLDRMVDEKLLEKIEALIGEEYIAGVKTGTQALGLAIGIGKGARQVPSTTGMIEILAKFGRAVNAYCRILVADVDVDDDATVARFTKAVAPIDLHRANSAAAGGGGDDEEIVLEPVTPTDPGVPVVAQPAREPSPNNGGPPFVTDPNSPFTS